MAIHKGIPAPRAVDRALATARAGTRSPMRKPLGVDDDRPPYASLALIAATAMGYEVLLARLLSIVQWSHFAFMIISVALLGCGASGMFLSYSQDFVTTRHRSFFIAQLALFGASAVACFVGMQFIPFNLEEVLWDIRQPLRLVAIYAMLALPFFFAANAFTSTMARFAAELPRICATGISGSGAGVLLMFALLFLFMPDTVLRTVGAVALAGAGLAWLEMRVEPRFGAAIFILLGIAMLLLPTSWTELDITPNKSLPQALQVGGANLAHERSSPMGLISVVENNLIPWNYAPGLSVRAKHEPPEQVGLYTDGDAFTAFTRPAKNSDEMDYLDQMTSALPYHLRSVQHVLSLGASGGVDVLQARFHGVPLIEAVEPNPQIAALARNDYGAFTGELYDAPDVKLHVDDARGFIAKSEFSYDLIQLSLLDSTAVAAAGIFALGEDYHYTVEAFREYLAHLEPGGYLEITRWINLPPRDTMKLLTTAATALRRNGILDPSEQIFLIRSEQTATLLIKNGPYTTNEIATMQTFCRQRGFDVGYFAGMKEEDTGLFSINDRAYFFMGSQSLLSDKRDAYIERYRFNLDPATDDRPFFYHFFRWKNLSEMLALRDKGGVALLEWSYLVLAATFVQTVLVALVIIFAPILFSRRILREVPHDTSVRRALGFFLAAGTATMFLTIALIEKFTLFLHHPLYAIGLVLPTLLIFGGAGSLYAQRIADTRHHRVAAWWAIGIAAALSFAYLVILGPSAHAVAAWPELLKMIVAVALLAPLGFCIGIPTPLALDLIGAKARILLPWAFGVGASAAVASAALAILLAMHFGYSFVVIAAVLLYGVIAWAFPHPQ